jgi:hypothetical protein
MYNVRYLAESENYRVTSEYEYVTLNFKNDALNKSICIGDFYGDPTCAIISRDEKYVAMAGCGIIIYKLIEPFENFEYDKTTSQYSELFRTNNNYWWIDGLHQSVGTDWKYIQFIARNDEGQFIYKMDTESFILEKIK